MSRIHLNQSGEVPGIRPSSPAHLDFLDGIRAAAAFYVLLAHCVIWGYRSDTLPNPKFAVDAFIILSGYLMMHLALTRFPDDAQRGWQSAKAFWLRRFFRIAPLYYVVLATAVLLSTQLLGGLQTLLDASQNSSLAAYVHERDLAGGLQYSTGSILMHLSFLFGLFPRYAANGLLPDWSIGLEMQFYAVFPLLFFTFKKLGAAASGILLYALGAVLAHLTPVWSGPAGFAEPSFLPLKLSLFIVGMLLAYAHHDLSRSKVRAIVQALLALGIAAQTSLFSAALVILIFIMQPDATPFDSAVDWLRRILGNRITRFLAEISYGIYLVHGFFLALAGGWLHRNAEFLHLRASLRISILILVTAAGTIVTSVILHYAIERPGISWGKRFFRRKPAPDSPLLKASGQFE